MADEVALLAGLRCPDCRAGGVTAGTDSLVCASCRARYPVWSGRPVLLRTDNRVFDRAAYSGVPPVERPSWLAQVIPSPSVNLASDRVMAELRRLLGSGDASILVVGGGRQRAWLDQRFRSATNLRLVYSDIDTGADVDLFCDAHDLPFADGVFDAVITTAVLEHVLYPERVAQEIARVVRIGGYLYSELPFMQQVHEGAYDFTRYTLSGHRRLFRDFEEVESGLVAGPATALVWAIETLALALSPASLPRAVPKAVVRIGFGWLKHLDRLIAGRPAAMDGASCTYFLGRRSALPVPDPAIIEGYVGAAYLRHT
jgi:SAM-dependent methyltransferase